MMRVLFTLRNSRDKGAAREIRRIATVRVYLANEEIVVIHPWYVHPAASDLIVNFVSGNHYICTRRTRDFQLEIIGAV